MITLKESYGDLKLCKFIYVMTKGMVNNISQHYVEPLKGYVYALPYDFNLLTNSGSIPDHNDIIDSIPEEVWNARVDYIRGKVDLWDKDLKLTIDFPEQFFKKEMVILYKLFNKYLIQRIPGEVAV